MKIKYAITGLDCPNCAAKLEGMLAKAEGITSAKINFLSEKLTVESDLAPDVLLEKVNEIGKSFSKKVVISEQ